MSDQELPLRAAIIPVTPLQQNCALIWCTATMKAAIVDPGGDVEVILSAIKEVGVTPEKVLLTHGHIDHAGGAAELAEALGIDIEGPHREDQWLLDTLAEVGPDYGCPDARNCTTDRWLEEGETVTIGDVSFDVLHCPGHTPGHIVFVNKDIKFAVLGDVLFQGSIGRTDFPRGDHAALINAIKTKVLPLGDDVTFICGHGPASTVGHERQTNPFLR
jgi:glyoxylase-like metal-dependent hydrolase (beta-lactamase superfamily II)